MRQVSYERKSIKLEGRLPRSVCLCRTSYFAEHLYIAKGGQNQLRNKESQITLCELPSK